MPSLRINWKEDTKDKDGNVVAADHTTRRYAECNLPRRLAKRDGRSSGKTAVKKK